jgi:hypothetical protein
MAKFIDVHSGFVGVTPEQFAAAHEADLKIQAEEGVTFERAWLDPSSGKAFCLITGPSRARGLTQRRLSRRSARGPSFRQRPLPGAPPAPDAAQPAPEDPMNARRFAAARRTLAQHHRQHRSEDRHLRPGPELLLGSAVTGGRRRA